MNDNHTLAPELAEAVDALAENLVVSAPFVALEQAYVRLQGDAQARDLLQNFKQAEAALRQCQANRTLTQSDMADYRALQVNVQADPQITVIER